MMKTAGESKKKGWRQAGLYTIVWLLAILFFAPIVIVILNSFKTKPEIMVSTIGLPEKFNLDNYVTIFTNNDFLSSLWFSVIVVVATTTLTVLVSALAGYALARWKSKFSSAIMLIFMTTLFVPFQVYMVALIVIARQLSLTGSPVGLVLIYIALGMPVPIFLYRSYAATMSKEIEEAAAIDGCSRIQMFFRVVFPLMKPITATAAVLNALWAWGEFLVAFLVYGNHKPMTIPLSQQYFYGSYNQQWNLIMAGFVISTIPIVIFYILMQKHIVKGIAAGAVKG
ncbi:carbohydrate ABC transporter permease [Paenibacillus antibioticophila]|uniref:Sugar ABC transporter permease n=2 Tax=Paenibacillus apis TaxID=1792174 RepID=A0A919XXT2_9BACL|nr:carbohydrate ABC transporter permease [Paenibacillus antibioticophila]GIO41286.1 sugar ABC transporter permease [Paenibacillus apis]